MRRDNIMTRQHQCTSGVKTGKYRLQGGVCCNRGLDVVPLEKNKAANVSGFVVPLPRLEQEQHSPLRNLCWFKYSLNGNGSLPFSAPPFIVSLLAAVSSPFCMCECAWCAACIG